MIDPSIVDEVRRLLAEDQLSQREIARRLGISRGTVGAIAGGRRPDRPPPGLPATLDDLDMLEPSERCPGCGGMVSMPCRLCLAQARRERLPRRPAPEPRPNGAPVVGLNLKPHHQERYERVRALRIEMERCSETIPEE